MTPAQASTAVFKRFRARWTVLEPDLATKVAYDNLTFSENDANETYVRVAIISLDSEPWTIGGKGQAKVKRNGLIQVRINTSTNAGRKRGDDLSQQVVKIFQAVRFGVLQGRDEGITTQISSVEELRRDSEAPHLWILNVTTPFEYYDLTKP